MKSHVDSNPVSSASPSAVGVVKGEPHSNGNGALQLAAPRPRKAAPPPATPPWFQLAVAAQRHWTWLVGAMVLGVVLGVVAGRKIWAPSFSAAAQLVRYDTPDPQLFQPKPINPATLVGMVNSDEVRTRVGARVIPVRSADAVGAGTRVAPVPNTDLVNIEASAPDAATAVANANLYAEEAVKFTQDMQARDARDAASYLRHQLTQLEKESAALDAKLAGAGIGVSSENGTSFSPALLARLETARNELADLQSRYTDLHPLVQLQQARVQAIEKQLPPRPAATDGAAAAASSATTVVANSLEVLREKVRTLEIERRNLSNRLQVTELLAANPVGHYRVFSPASAERTGQNNPAMKIAVLAAFLGLVGLFLGMLGAVTDEALDPRLRSPDDVRRVTQLPVLARLGPIDRMSTEARASWAFRTWTALQSRLSPTPNQGLVCGVISSSAGEGRSVWLKLLADAASKCGFSVVLITTRPPGVGEEARPASAAASSAVRFRTGRGEPKAAEAVLVNETTLSDAMLHTPEEMAGHIFTGNEDGPSVVHIPLPGWVWNLEHRKEWLASLNTWGANENAVVLVELPPASSPEGILLAQNLPNVLWLADATKATALETRQQIETLRMARVNLVGAVVNRSNGTHLNERFARWVPVPAMAALALFCSLGSAPRAEAHAADAVAPESFSIVSPAQRAAWQQKLTLGPGDVLRVGIYGEPAARTEITVQPDGRLNYLEARDVVANGLTIDELRGELDRALGQYRRSPRTMISPVAFRSKKYHMLGLVAQKGSFTLDRPMTVVEAVARARGFETSAATGDVTELADLSHAFLIRNGQRKTVDFERLFSAGDLSQNIAVEPGDYFYFPPADQREVYVLGEVLHPGPATLADKGTSLRAIATRGGFTDKAWRQRVLVVRGSLAQPETIVVNLRDVLSGEAPDIALEPHDIVYVSPRPWAKAEDLLDDAATAFTQAFVVYWTSDKVIPVVPLR